MKLPLYTITIDENDDGKQEVNYIALTDNPAIMSNFLAFDKTQSFFFENEEERIITGLAMVADLPIYRRDKVKGEFYTVFQAPTIKQIAQKFFRKQYNFNLNENHDKNKKTEGVYIFESWIVDRDKGKYPMKQFEDVSNGSWIISAKIDNDKIWNDVKEGKFTGFSVEGIFGLTRLEYNNNEDDLFLESLKNILRDIEL